jgi:putative hemolysin
MKSLAEQGVRKARWVLRITEDSTRALATLKVGTTLVIFFLSAKAATDLALPLASAFQSVLGDWARATALPVVIVPLTLISLVLGELVPKKLGSRHAEAIALIMVTPLQWLRTVTDPIVYFSGTVADLLLRLMGNPPTTEEVEVGIEEVKAMVDAARTGGAVSEQERRIIYGAVELSSIPVRAIMVPRVEIQHLKASTTLEAALQMVSENAHTRLPVCDDDLDNIIGILHVKDLIRPLPELLANPPTLRQLLRPVSYAPEALPATDLLRQMQRNRLHMMIVRDEYGGTAGLVTLEDVLEEIVGEIRDEYDAEEEREFRRVSQHEGVFKLRASIATVNNELDIHLPRDEAATLIGLFLEELERPPAPGDYMEIDNVRLSVLEDGQCVRVGLILPKPDEDEPLD